MSETTVVTTTSDPGPPQIGESAERKSPPRRLPATTVELASHTSSSLITGLTSRSPFMLGIVVLNVIGIASAVYFLNLLIKGQQEHLNQLLTVQQSETREFLKMHDREFDSLMKINRDVMIPLIPVQPSPAPPPSTASEVPPESYGPPIPERRP